MEHWIRDARDPQRLFLAWTAPDHIPDRFRWAVGVIEPKGVTSSLRYFHSEAEFASHNSGKSLNDLRTLGYLGYPGFRPRREPYLEAGIALSRRLPPRSRPDFNEYKRQFRLAPEVQFGGFALLGRTEAKLPSDGFSVVDPLDPGAEDTDLLMEVAGYRYYVADLAQSLKVGDKVEVCAEPDNEKDPGAVQLLVRGQKIGNVNRLQAPTFREWLGRQHVFGAVERLNGSPEKPRAFVFVSVRPTNSPLEQLVTLALS